LKDSQKKLQGLNYNGLLDNLAHYKTTNIQDNSGDLLQSSAWTAQAIEQWFDQDKFWTDGLDKDKNRRVLSLAGFIHNIGKGGDLEFTYEDKLDFPFTGYEYLTGKRIYKKNEFDQTLDVPGWLNTVIKESNDLGHPITKNDKKLIMILAAVYSDFGNVVRKIMSPQKYLEILKFFAHQTGYNNGKVDERLVRAAILIGAADIRAARPVNYRSTEFADLAHIYMSPHAKLGTDTYKNFNMESDGKVARDDILKQFAELPIVLKDSQKKLQGLNHNGLLDNLAQYKTTDVEFHSGDLLQSSAWTAQAIEQWFDQNEFWTDGLDKDTNKRVLSLAGFIHNIGKGGDLDFTYGEYNAKSDYPLIGYEYLTGKRVYKKNELDQTLDVPGWLNTVIKESNDLGHPITEDDKKLIMILAAVHRDFEAVVLEIMSPQKYFENLKRFAQLTGYNNGKVDERLVRAAILIGAAYIRAARQVNYPSSEFVDLAHIYMSPHAKLATDKYKKFNMETNGKAVRDDILKQFAELQIAELQKQPGWDDWLKSKLYIKI
ncbi:MAG TPA: hypothetical protein QGF02_02995, partial [Candidatus Babeliales bacterium]|nr:hypothetical protein [Candidatus Babeliales bacterium]